MDRKAAGTRTACGRDRGRERARPQKRGRDRGYCIAGTTPPPRERPPLQDLWTRSRSAWAMGTSRPDVTFQTTTSSRSGTCQRATSAGCSRRAQDQWYSPRPAPSSPATSLARLQEAQDRRASPRAAAQDARTPVAWTTTRGPSRQPSRWPSASTSATCACARRRRTLEEFLILAAARAAAVLKGDYEILDDSPARTRGQNYEPMWPRRRAHRPRPTRGSSSRRLRDAATAPGSSTPRPPSAWTTSPPPSARACRRSAGPPRRHVRAETAVVGGSGSRTPTGDPARPRRARAAVPRGQLRPQLPARLAQGHPLMQYPVEGWFVQTTAVKDRWWRSTGRSAGSRRRRTGRFGQCSRTT